MSIEQSRVGRYLIFIPHSGQGEAADYMLLKQAVLEAVQRGERFLAINSRGVEYIYSEFINFLTEIRKDLADSPAPAAIALVEPSESLAHLVEIARLGNAIQVFKNFNAFEQAAV